MTIIFVMAVYCICRNGCDINVYWFIGYNDYKCFNAYNVYISCYSHYCGNGHDVCICKPVISIMIYMATMALMTIIHEMSSLFTSFAILDILVIIAVVDTVIMASMAITTVMATLAAIDIMVWMTSITVIATTSLEDFEATLTLMTLIELI